MCYYRLWCAVPWLLVVGGQVQDSRLCVQAEGYCSTRPKNVEHIISAINHSVASSWFFFSMHFYKVCRLDEVCVTR